MSDPDDWSALFGEMLVKLVSAAGWRVDFHDRVAGTSLSRTSAALGREDQVCLERVIRGSCRQIGPGNTTYAWHEAAKADVSVSNGRVKVFSFRADVSSGQKVRVAMLLDRNALAKSAFETEIEFLEYCCRMISFFVGAAEAMSYAEIFRQIAASISLGGIVADSNGKVVMNIGHKDGEVPDCLKPVFENPESAKRMLRQVVSEEVAALGKAADGQSDRPAGEGLIAMGGQNRCVLHAIPVRQSAVGSEGGRVLVAVLEPFAARCPSSQSLKRVYALTPAEARVVERLVRGLPIKEISRVLKLSDNTVRTYLKRSFEKVGVSSQQQLIYAVSGMLTEALAGHSGSVEATAAE